MFSFSSTDNTLLNLNVRKKSPPWCADVIADRHTIHIDMKGKTLHTTSIRPPGVVAYVYNLHILRARVKFLVKSIFSQVHFRVPVVPLFLHQNTIIYPGKCGPFGNLGGCIRTRRTPPPPPPPAYGPVVYPICQNLQSLYMTLDVESVTYLIQYVQVTVCLHPFQGHILVELDVSYFRVSSALRLVLSWMFHLCPLGQVHLPVFWFCHM